MNKLKRLIVCSGTASEVQGVPTVIKLLPMGLVKSQKGDFVVDEESFQAIKETFQRRALDIVIDYEHQTLEDIEAPAGGWIKELSLQDDAIVGKVEWTPKAEEYLKNKEYRYLSPVVLVRKSDQKAVVLHSVALTNTPAIDGMYPIINSLDISEYEEGGTKMDLKKLAELLGLSADATEEEVMQKLQGLQANSTEEKKEEEAEEEEIVANKTITDLLGVASNAKTEDVAAAIMALKNPSGYVPISEFKALKERLDKKDSDELVTKALKDGKISAAQKAWADEYALKDPKGFQKFVEKAPQVVPVGEIDFTDGERRGAQKQDEVSMTVCKMLGISDDDLQKYGGK
ncbi:phage protease [Paenibacillus alvei]|uniref:phage protease n=1 Tax=Paenibacillus alvei TaxID=44250 RepID=UPI002280029C|nr:phage protease [Paenibacillus alvei]MCY9756654.1 phage protease [Paenibacillus alvei]